MPALDNAISDLQLVLAAFNHGTTQGGQPTVREHSQEWFELRATTLALQYLRRVKALGLESDPAACERLYRACAAMFKSAEPPPEILVPRELLPDGSPPLSAVT